MRTYGRVSDVFGVKKWIVVETTADGYDDYVWLTTLAQTLKLNLGESPFFADYGIPAHPSVSQQIPPDFYVAFTQQHFAQYFASLLISRQSGLPPTYDVNVITHQGVRLSISVPIAT